MPFFLHLEQRGAYFLIAVKHSGRKGSQVIKDRLTCGHNTPRQANKRERKSGRYLTWTLRRMPPGVGDGELAGQRNDAGGALQVDPRGQARR